MEQHELCNINIVAGWIIGNAIRTQIYPNDIEQQNENLNTSTIEEIMEVK